MSAAEPHTWPRTPNTGKSTSGPRRQTRQVRPDDTSRSRVVRAPIASGIGGSKSISFSEIRCTAIKLAYKNLSRRGFSSFLHFFPQRIVDCMNLVESIERSLDWLATPKHLPGRLEMQTQRGRRLEMEIVSFAIHMPIAGGVMLRFPVFMMIMPVGSSPIQGSQARSEQDND